MPTQHRTRTGGVPRTADDIVTAALALAEARGLLGWTVRELAQEVGTWQNVVYHHVGDRETVIAAVLERIVGQMPTPPTELPWQEWFRRTLTEGRRVLRRFPGAAGRLCRDGPSVSSAARIIDLGVGKLLEAGFGDEAPQAYSLLFNSCLLLVAIDDERRMAGASGRDVALAMLGTPPPVDAGAGWRTMTAALQRAVDDPDYPDNSSQFDYALERTIAGLEQRLAELRTAGGSAR